MTLNEVQLNGVMYVARKDVFNIAQGLVGQVVEAVVRSEQKGTYLNHYLDFISPSTGSVATPPPPQQAPPPQYVQEAQLAQQPPQAPPVPVAQVLVQQELFDLNVSIHRQVAAKVSAQICTNPVDFWASVDAVFHYFQTGQKPTALPSLHDFISTNVAAATEQQYQPPKNQWTVTDPSPQANQFIPAGAVQTSETYQHTDDDIPF